MIRTVMGIALASTTLLTAAQAADVVADAGAKIVAPLEIENTAALYFGTVAPSLTDDDTVAVKADGSKVCGAELSCLTDDHTAAEFAVTGANGQSYTITLPREAKIANGDGDEMEITNFAGSKASGTLSGGKDSFTVGGILNVAAKQPEGDYKGTFVVTVEYQ